MSPPLIPYAAARHAADLVNAATAEASRRLAAVPGVGSGPMGLTPDAVKASPEYRQARAYYQAAHEHARRINAWLQRHYRAETRADARARRANMNERTPR